MKEFQVLCTTMHQVDFKKIEEMNIKSDVIFANQTDVNRQDKILFGGNEGLMVSTTLRGVGNNRNTALMYADAKICLMADDDMKYCDDYKEKILAEFNNHPEADIIIFNINTSTPEFGRIPTQIKRFKKFHIWSKNPYGAPRIAFRIDKIKQKNIWFSTFFGGGCIYKSGEDSIWIEQLRKSGLKIYLSPINIGSVSYEKTTSFIEDESEKFYTLGAIMEATKNFITPFKVIYYSFIRKNTNISKIKKISLIKNGRKGYISLLPYKNFILENKENLK